MIELVVFDMAGTTVRDEREVETCFARAAAATGLVVSAARITAVQGWAKRFVFETLWAEYLGPHHPDLPARVAHSYDTFRTILEDHYRTHPVRPTDGCLDLLGWLKAHGVKTALTTGFYRLVTDIILQKLGWAADLDAHYVGNAASLIGLSVASDEVAQGRPAPLMIQRAMATLGVTDPAHVLNVGDTPSDLESGRRAGCRLSVGLTNGTHTRAQLDACPHDGVFGSLTDLHHYLQEEQLVG